MTFQSKITPYRFQTLFTIVDVAQCLYTIQKFCFDFAAVFEIISPDRLLTAGAKAQFWASFMLTWEMMTLSAIATYTLRPSRSIFFDKYPIVDSASLNAAVEKAPIKIHYFFSRTTGLLGRLRSLETPEDPYITFE
ncbi:unnamed protein product [Angiostrongylus costaricensis]|uniref:PhoLip_ATPase_C domain-containing protein n=1 Tax=Angiostrongylus costaricensis TaxID=334426 RepID=A0A0R3PGS3_ANGCS|nr:unnamed protein product [Angiostrongylus costaricensis]